MQRVSIRLPLAAVTAAIVIVLAVPSLALAQKHGGGGKAKGGGGKPHPAATARPSSGEAAPERALPTYKPKNEAALSIRYQIVEGHGAPETIVVIRGDGEVRYKRGDDVRNFRLKKAQLKFVTNAIHEAGFRHLDPVYGDRALTPDPPSKTVITKSRKHSVSCQDFLDSEHPSPPAFHALTDKLDKLVKRMQKVPSPKIPFSGVAITVETDRTTYAATPTGPPASMWAAIAISNSSEEPLRLEFPSAQKYDFAVRDESGAEVYRWSKGREFDPKPTKVPIQKGGAHWVEQIPLMLPSGAPLPPGDYVLDWRLAGSLPSAGQVAFAIADRGEAAAPAPPAGPSPAQNPKPARGAGKQGKGGGGKGGGGKRQKE
jgi:intracellular proteinase inhibitor BsuPI